MPGLPVDREVLGIAVSPALWDRWRAWFAPHRQPFSTERLAAVVSDGRLPGRRVEPGPEVRDTFSLYGGHRWTWLTRGEYEALPPVVRGRLGPPGPPDRTARPIVRWPRAQNESMDRFDQQLSEFVHRHWPVSAHRSVAASTWAAAAAVLPGARRCAGTFPDGSGPNCFGTVMGAAGESDTAETWMQVEPFQQWLASSAIRLPRKTGASRDHEPGVVLLWRDSDGTATHTAVTLGDGWALNKPSQAWFTPRAVWTVRDVIRLSRERGDRLERHHLTCRA